jgi:hypothetical protein
VYNITSVQSVSKAWQISDVNERIQIRKVAANALNMQSQTPTRDDSPA